MSKDIEKLGEVFATKDDLEKYATKELTTLEIV